MGDPIAGNPTQYMLEKAIEAGQLDWRFLSLEVSGLDFEGALRGARVFGFRGILLTAPHDVAVLPYLEEVSEVARLGGQVNCITQSAGRLTGENTIGRALRHLAQQSLELEAARVTILGQGTLAKTLAAELALAGVKNLVFAAEQTDAVEKFAESLAETTGLESARCEVASSAAPLSVASDCNLLVNTLSESNGLSLQALPMDYSSIPTGAVVVDLAYNPPQTALLQAAQETGATTIDGLTILIEQTAIAFETWTGSTADRQAMREAVEEFLVL